MWLIESAKKQKNVEEEMLQGMMEDVRKKLQAM